MANEFVIKKPKDLTKVNGSDMGELLWWSHQLNTSPETLIAVISQVGNSIEMIKKHVKLSRS